MAALVAFANRSVGAERVFPGDGSVVFALGDAWYHARRAWFTFEHFPRILGFDPLLNYPDGAPAPWPPLYDFALGAVARLFGDSQPTFERVAAWAPVVLGTLGVLPIYFAGRLVASRAAGVGAAFLFALLPATVVYSNVGNADHHAAQSLLGATLLALSLAAVSTIPDPRASPAKSFAGLVVARVTMLLTWPGSLVYLAIVEGSLLGAGVLSGRRSLLVGEAWSTALSALLVLPFLPLSETTVGGSFSAIELSWLHPALLGIVAMVAALLAAWERARPAGSSFARSVRAATLLIPLLATLAAASGLWTELMLGLDYVAKTDAYQGQNLEQFPLFSFATGFSIALGLATFGGFVALIPIVPIVAMVLALRSVSRRAPLLVLTAWCAAFGALALLQVRFGNDYAPAGSVGFALLLGAVSHRIARGRPTAARVLAFGIALVLLAPVIDRQARSAIETMRAFREAEPARDRALESYEGTMLRFAELVREATPETQGFDDPGRRPEYGILAYPGIGHVLHYAARRATPADNFGPYIGAANYTAVGAFFPLESEERAVEEARRLRSRYVVTTDYGGSVPTTLTNRLHRSDGNAAAGRPAFGRFRLVTEGPAGGRPIGEQFGRPIRERGVPYKLFEVVPGAVLDAKAPPGTRVRASVTISTPAGRRFPWRTEAVADADGTARLRIPYATRTTAPARPEGPFRVSVGDRILDVEIPEQAVLSGSTIPVSEDAS
jgi:dolichyl-diphosphooligosaccharide--protein glycosyltransferase